MSNAQKFVNEEIVDENETKQDIQNDTQEEDNKDPAFEEIKAAFQEAYAKEGADDEAVKMAMLMAGAKFANVARYFNQLMVEFGFTKSKEERNQILDKLLSGLDLTIETTFDEALNKTAETLDVNERSAATSVRMWCKKNEVEFFKKPKAEPSESRSSFDTNMYQWILDNMNATVEQFTTYLDEVGTENTKRFRAKHLGIFDFVQKIKAKY